MDVKFYYNFATVKCVNSFLKQTLPKIVKIV
jgi:hypothetical protein